MGGILTVRRSAEQPGEDSGLCDRRLFSDKSGWHGLAGRLSGDDTLVVVRIDRIGRRWLDTLQCIIAHRAGG